MVVHGVVPHGVMQKEDIQKVKYAKVQTMLLEATVKATQQTQGKEAKNAKLNFKN